jgi:hypothetical protein
MTFTTQPPTKPGAYWFKRDRHEPRLLQVDIDSAGLLYDPHSLCGYGDRGQWSERLIPVSEVEKAWREGYNWTNYTPVGSEVAWSDSHARKVVEGEV